MRYIAERADTLEIPQSVEYKPRYEAELRRELSERNIRWAQANDFPHEISLGSTPAVLYRNDDAGRHGNFYPSAYRRILANPAWNCRLGKSHTSARKILLSHDSDRRELDSCNSSDALLMSVFCNSQALQPGSKLLTLLGADPGSIPDFGYGPGIPLRNGRADRTEIDMRLGNLLFEAKLTEYDFQTAPLRLVERYRDFEEIFDVEALPRSGDSLLSYQLIRGVLAANAQDELCFCVICDSRRPDLIADWYRVLQCVRFPALRCRLMLLTWQEIAAASPRPLQRWLDKKYGIVAI